MSTGINNPERLPVEDEKLTLPAEPAGADGPAWLSNPTTGNIELVSLQYGSAEMASLRGLYYGGDFQLPKFDAPARVKDNITIGQDGKVTIDYPAVAGEPHKSRTLVPDGAGGFKEIITKTDGEGTSHLVKRGNEWFASFQGMEFPMKGVKVDPNTYEVSIKNPSGLWRREGTDGSVRDEKENADGSLTTVGPNGEVQRITRTDNSTIEQRDANTIVESAGGKSTTWKKQGNEWVSDNGQKRTDFKLDANGLTTYKNVGDGLTYRIAGDGSQVIEGEGRSKITLDAQNRVKSIEWPDRKERREFEYFGESKDIKVVKKTDLQTGTTYTNTRENAQSTKWHVETNNGQRISDWNGSVSVLPGGAYSRQFLDGPHAKDGKWLTWWPDGKETHDTVDAQGTRTSYDAQGKVLFKQATTGARTEYDAAGGMATVKTNDNTTFEIKADKIKMVDGVTGETINFTKSGDTWTSDSKRFPGARKNLAVSEQGTLSYTNEAGEQVSERRDNTKSIRRGAQVFEYGAKGDLQSVTFGDTTRKFEIKNGVLTATDTKAGQEPKVVFDSSKVGDPKSVRINKETGDISFTTDKGATVVRGNGLTIELDKFGNQTKVTRPDGSSREFAYVTQKEKPAAAGSDPYSYDGSPEGADKPAPEGKDVQVLAKIIDRNAKGEIKDEWTAKSDGTRVTGVFVNTPKEGQKPRERENIEVCQDGNYKFNKPGDKTEYAARLGGDGAPGMSADIEEARENLRDVLRDKLDESQRVRFDAMMKQFEQRMADRLEARMAAGITAPEKIRQEVEQAIKGTYDNLAKMVSTPSDPAKPTFMDQATRVRLAENFMLHAMDPMTMDQGPSGPGEEGGHGTCWIQGAHIWGMVQHPDAMADLLRQVSIDGQYTTKNSGENDPASKTISFSKEMLAIRQGTQESRWTVDRAMKEWEELPGMRRQILSDRSPVGFIFDNVLPVIGGRQEKRIDGGNFDTINAVRGYNSDGSYRTEKITGSGDIMYMVTGDKPASYHTWNHPDHIQDHLLNVNPGTSQEAKNENFRRTLLEKGSILTHTMNHTSSRQIIKVNGEWLAVQDDQHGENSDYVVGKVTDLAAYAKGSDAALQRAQGQQAVPRVVIPGVVNDVSGPVNASQVRYSPTQRGQQWDRAAGGCPGPGPCPSPDGGSEISGGCDRGGCGGCGGGGCGGCGGGGGGCGGGFSGFRPMRPRLLGRLFGRRCR